MVTDLVMGSLLTILRPVIKLTKKTTLPPIHYQRRLLRLLTGVYHEHLQVSVSRGCVWGVVDVVSIEMHFYKFFFFLNLSYVFGCNSYKYGTSIH